MNNLNNDSLNITHRISFKGDGCGITHIDLQDMGTGNHVICDAKFENREYFREIYLGKVVDIDTVKVGGNFNCIDPNNGYSEFDSPFTVESIHFMTCLD